MQVKDVMRELSRPFDANKVHWRVGSTNKEKTEGMALAYIDARDVMDRFDEVIGPLWSNEYPFEGCCKIGIMFDGDWCYRSNGAGQTDFEGQKGQYSDAFKRAAVLWGVGRYLYGITNTWTPIKPKGRSYGFVKNPQLPRWALPDVHDAICDVKEGIAHDDLSLAASSFFQLDEKTRDELWIAPTKGGIFTTKEREIMKSSEFREAK